MAWQTNILCHPTVPPPCLIFSWTFKKKESKTESILFFPDFFCQSFYFMVSLNCQAMKILKFQRMLDIWKTFTSAFPTLTLTDWPQGNETKMPPKSPQMLVKQFWGTAWVLLKLKLNTPNRHNDSWPTAFATSNSKILKSEFTTDFTGKCIKPKTKEYRKSLSNKIASKNWLK